MCKGYIQSAMRQTPLLFKREKKKKKDREKHSPSLLHVTEVQVESVSST